MFFKKHVQKLIARIDTILFSLILYTIPENNKYICAYFCTKVTLDRLYQINLIIFYLF